MAISSEGVRRLFDEEVGRPIDEATAQAVASVVGPLIDGLNLVPPEPLFPVEPSLAFQATYPREREAARWPKS